ncbi:MAG TPA: hypothetical protein VES42_28785 [Pilimelia sp.]|nr:hypothetical protein [Pilimelia sp.]
MRRVTTLLAGSVAAIALVIGMAGAPASAAPPGFGSPETSTTTLGPGAVKAQVGEKSAAAAYTPQCQVEAGSVLPTYGSVRGVPAWFATNTLFGPGDYCQTGKALLLMQGDGNLVVYDENFDARWSARDTHPQVMGNGYWAYFQGFDANFVVYNSNSSRAYWASNTCCRTGARLAIQADGNVVIYSSNWSVLWKTNSNH